MTVAEASASHSSLAPAVCASCTHPQTAEANAALLRGESVRSIARRLEMSMPSLYRHARASHHLRGRVNPDTPPAAPTSQPPATPLSHDQDDREAEILVRNALRHLKRAMTSAEDKDRNGAITAARNALEHRAKLRGRLIPGGVNVTLNSLTSVAVAEREQAASMSAFEVTEQAGAWLGAQLEAGSADAVRTVRALMRMLPSAEVAAGDAVRESTGEGEREVGSDAGAHE